MSIPKPPQPASRDVALAAIAEAQRRIGLIVQVDETAFNLKKENISTWHPSNEQPHSAQPSRGASRGRLVLGSLMGLLAVACIGLAAFAWPSPHDQAAPEPISTSSVSARKTELPTQPSPPKADVAANTAQAQTTLQRVAPVVPTASPIAADLEQSIQMITRELANVEQGIIQLKTGQAQMVRDNAELAEHLKATQEMARHNADLAEDLKAAQAQMARDNVNFADQLKASQGQMAAIAESQEKITRLLVGAEQKQRPRTPASSPLPIANPTRSPLPSPPHVRVQTQAPKLLQPKQQ